MFELPRYSVLAHQMEIYGLQLSGSVLLTTLLGLVIGLLTYWVISKRRSKLPPGPTPLPLIGNMLQIKLPKIHEEVYKLSKKYGPVVSVYLGPSPTVFVNDIDTALEVLVKKSTDFATRKNTASTDAITDGSKDIAMGEYGPTWKLHRKLASKALRQYLQGDALEKRVHDAMETTLQAMEEEKGPFDPANYIYFTVLNILTGLCFGEKYAYGDEEIMNFIDMSDRFTAKYKDTLLEDVFPYFMNFYETKAFRELKEDTKKLNDVLVMKKFKEHKMTFNRDNIRDFTDMLLLAKLESEEENGNATLESLTDTHLFQTCNDIYLGGTDTSRYTLRYAILHMIANPHIQKKVQQEIDDVVGRDRLPGVSDRKSLGYTEAVLHESMRLGTIAPVGLPHATTCDTSIGEYKIPKGTQVIVNHWALHNDPDAWENVNEFRPERFLDDEGKLGPKPQNWLPFSAGKRVCLGEFVAKPQLHLIFASLMQRFTWKLEPGAEIDLTPEEGALGVSYSKPYKVVIERRV